MRPEAGSHVRWGQDADTFIRKHYKQDMNAATIAKALNRTRSEVIGRARRLGLCSNSGEARPGLTTDILALVDSGLSKAEAARRTGCSKQHASMICRRHGWNGLTKAGREAKRAGGRQSAQAYRKALQGDRQC